jgi:hypothetical protein
MHKGSTVPDKVEDGRDLMVNDGMKPALAFHPKAFSMVWPMPKRIDILIGTGVLRAPGVPEHPNYRYQYERTGEATV